MRGRRLRLGLAVLGAAMAAALAVTIAGCGEKAAETGEKDPVRIGVILDESGGYAAMGKAERRALELETERINKAGGVNGHKLELIYANDESDQAKAVSELTRLIDSDEIVALIGTTGTGTSMAVRGDIARAGIAQISLAGGAAITEPLDERVFQTPWPNRIVVPFVLEALADAGHTKVALLSDAGPYGKDGRAIILKAAADAGITLVEDLTFNVTDTDVSAQLTAIKSSDATAILLWTADGKAGPLVVKGAADLGIDLPMYGGSGQARAEFITGAGEAGEGFVFGTGKSLVPSTWGEDSELYEVNSDFAKRYEEKYGEKPDIFAGHAFDAITLLVDALERVDEPDAESILTALKKTKDVPGFAGSFTFSDKDHNGLTEECLALFRIENGEWVPVED